MHDYVYAYATAERENRTEGTQAELSEMLEALDRYIYHGIHPGSFLSFVIANDLKMAMMHGSMPSISLLHPLVTYLYNEAPSDCWGSVDNVRVYYSHKALQEAWAISTAQRHMRAEDAGGTKNG